MYNLAYTQALLHLTCKFNEDERLSWINRGTVGKKGSHVGEANSAKADSRRTSEVHTSRRLSSHVESSGSRRLSQSGEATVSTRRQTLSAVGGRTSTTEETNVGRPCVTPTEKLLQTIIKNLTTIRFYPSDDAAMSVSIFQLFILNTIIAIFSRSDNS